MAGKLHEVLAVESDLVTTAKKVNEEAIKTFARKDEHFIGSVSSVRHFNEDDKRLDAETIKAMVTTVPDKLAYLVVANRKALDAFVQKEATNQVAKADVELDGSVVLKDMPATALLGLETRLRELRAVYEHIPTLAPGQEWQLDPEKGKYVYASKHPEIRFRTRKTLRPIEMSPATKEHPAQVQAVQEDTPIAKITDHVWSGMMSTSDKSDLLARIDTVIRAVKKARQRANNTEVVKRDSTGAALFSYIHNGMF